MSAHSCGICGRGAGDIAHADFWLCEKHSAGWDESEERAEFMDRDGNWYELFAAWVEKQRAAPARVCPRCHLSPCMCVHELLLSPSAAAVLELAAVAMQLGPNARRVLLEVAKRLAKGAGEHGDFDPSVRRNWAAEAAEEHLDALVYMTLDALERAEKKPEAARDTDPAPAPLEPALAVARGAEDCPGCEGCTWECAR